MFQLCEGALVLVLGYAESQGIWCRFILLSACGVLIIDVGLYALSNHKPCVDIILAIAGMNTWFGGVEIFHVDSLVGLEILSPMPFVLMSVAYPTVIAITGDELASNIVRWHIQIVAVLGDPAKKSHFNMLLL